MASSSRPDDDGLLSNIFLRSCVFERVDDLSLELFLEATKNQPCVFEHERNWRKRTWLGNLGILHVPAPNPKAKTICTGRRTRLVSVPSENTRVK